MTSAAIVLARLRGCAVRLHLYRACGPGPRHPESMTAELGHADEEWLALADGQLWPQHADGGRLRADYTCNEEGGSGDD